MVGFPMSRRHKPRYIPQENEFFPGVTVRDAAEMLCTFHTVVRYHIDRGNLKARQSGKTWLIDLESIRQLRDRSTRNVSSSL